MFGFIGKLFGAQGEPAREDEEVMEVSEDEVDEDQIAYRGYGTLYCYNPLSGVYEPKLDSAIIQLAHEALFQYRLRILNSDGVLMMTRDPKKDFEFDNPTHSFEWLMNNQNWRLQFDNPDVYMGFKHELLRAVYESKRREKMDKLFTKDGDRDWIVAADDMMDIEPDEKYEDESDDEIDFIGDEHSDVESDDVPFRTPTKPGRLNQTGEKNEDLSVGMANNRHFVVRGNKIGIFKHDDDSGELEYVSQINSIKTPDGKLFSPVKSMLHQNDRKMLFLNPDEKSKVYCMDLETEKVTDQWSVLDDSNVNFIAPIEKYAQRSNEQMILGVTNNSVFNIDPRQHGKDKAAGSFSYKKNPKFEVTASAGNGDVAVGSETGEIRLYNNISLRSKTLFPGLGDPITALDITEDSKWILATTDTYLMVISTKKPNGKTGFQNVMGPDEKPAPKKLTLKLAHRHVHGIEEVKFSPARFNTGENIDEKWIVSSTGNFIITWNFNSIKRGRLHDYKLKRVDQQVVGDQFLFGKEDDVVVALENDVYAQKRGKASD